MLRYLFFTLLLFKSLVSLSQQYGDDYTVAEFEETYLGDLKTKKINPKSIENLLIINLGFEDPAYISSLPIKKLSNVKKLYLGGDDYDYDLREIPMEFLRLKSLKTIILQYVADPVNIARQVKKYRPDIVVKCIDFDSSIKIISSEFDRESSHWKIKIVYPNQVISHMGFEIDSILRKENLNSNDYLLLSLTYISKNTSYQHIKMFEFLDSLYAIYGDDSVYYKCNCEQPSVSSTDTVKAIDYLNKALALDDTSYSTLRYACYFYQSLVVNKNKACYYFKKLQNTPLYQNLYSISNQDAIYIPFKELIECDSSTH